MWYNPDTHLPVSEAVTLYDLWDDICQAVTDEPKRLYMGSWIVSSDRDVEELQLTRPQCNTICCWAGWAIMAHGDSLDVYGFERRGKFLLCGYSPEFDYTAAGGTEYDAWTRLRADTTAFFYYEPSEIKPRQSPAYVADVVARARHIMATHEAYLRSHLVPAHAALAT